MSTISNFKIAHTELLDIAGEIAGYFDSSSKVTDSASEIRKLLVQLSGKLSFHLSMEDNYLYPKLMQDADPKIADTAKKFADEMSGIANVFKEYSTKWQEKTIAAEPDNFITATKGLFVAVQNRINREETELYLLLNE